MGDKVHFKVTFEVRPEYNMTQEMAAYAWTKFAEFKTDGPRLYRVEGSREFGKSSGFASYDLANVTTDLIHYVQAAFPKIGFDITEFWMKLERDE